MRIDVPGGQMRFDEVRFQKNPFPPELRLFDHELFETGEHDRSDVRFVRCKFGNEDIRAFFPLCASREEGKSGGCKETPQRTENNLSPCPSSPLLRDWMIPHRSLSLLLEKAPKAFPGVQGKEEQGNKRRVVRTVFFLSTHALANPGRGLTRLLPPGPESQNAPSEGERCAHPRHLGLEVFQAFFHLGARNAPREGAKSKTDAVRLSIQLLPIHQRISVVPSASGQLSIHQQADSLTHPSMIAKPRDPEGKNC